MSVVLPVNGGPATALHALNRIAFGPRPGDIRRVLSQGLAAWIDDQLRPTPDSVLASRLAPFPTLSYTVPQVVANANANSASLTQVQDEFQTAKVIRAVHSKNQLEEVLVDFWFNHFNVYMPDDFLQYSTPAYERDAIRPFVLGRFRDLLAATANHVAMMFYLDNYLSRVSRVVNGVLVQGLNENYGRELMELHTVGVDAGYTQEHVFDAARCFTGWGIDNVSTGGSFQYRSTQHDTGAKQVFGLSVPAGGQKNDGDMLIDYLATHPSTARFISKKLARRFVSDDPPASIVDRCAATFSATGGDIREVLTTMFSSTEFWEEARSGDGKPKTPVEFTFSAIRACDAQVQHANSIRGQISNMGMPLYQCIPPTGYSGRGADWLNPSSHLNRMNFALDLAAGRIGGIVIDPPALVHVWGGTADDPRSAANLMNDEILGRKLRPDALQTLTRVATGGTPTVAAKVIGLCLASAPMQVR
jgi:uncharacterized protein (DUF1800 family)